MSLTSLVAMFCVLVLQRKSLAEEMFGYVLHDGVRKYNCTTEPLPGKCSFDYPVANFGSLQVESAANSKQIFDILNTLLGNRSIPDSCNASLKNFFCKRSFQLNCSDEFIQHDIEGIKTSCEKAEKDCKVIKDVHTQNVIKSMINCSEPIYPMCESFPEVRQDPFPCAERNYKVMMVNFTGQVKRQVATRNRLMRLSNNISRSCLHDVGEMICKNVAPACNRNETIVVKLVSRQECERIISCLNTTPEVERFKESIIDEWCRSSPDANTAKKLSLSLVYTNFEAGPTPKSGDKTAPAEDSPSPTDKTGAQTTAEIPPYHNKTRHILSEKQPTVQGNLSKEDTRSRSTETSVFNGTIQKKKNTTSDSSVPNPNETTKDPKSSKFSKTISNLEKFKLNPTPSLMLTASIRVLNPNKTAKRNQANAVVNKATFRVIKVTSSTFLMSVASASFRRPINATEKQVLATVSSSKNVDIPTSQDNSSAPQLNTGSKGLPVCLLISILTVYMW